MAHYLNFFIESGKATKAKVVAIDERIVGAKRELYKVKVWTSKVD